MSFINDAIRKQIDAEHIEVFFVSGAATKWWNAQRTDKKQEVALLGGYYWTRGTEESGPFRSPSAAYRDAYYRRLLEQPPPCMNKNDVARAEKELKSQAKTRTFAKGRGAPVRLRA